MNAWHRTADQLPDDETEVLGYYSESDEHSLLHVMTDDGGTDWFRKSGWGANAPDFWRHLDKPEDEPPRPGIHYAGDGHNEPREYLDPPSDTTDEEVDDALADQLFEEDEEP